MLPLTCGITAAIGLLTQAGIEQNQASRANWQLCDAALRPGTLRSFIPPAPLAMDILHSPKGFGPHELPPCIPRREFRRRGEASGPDLGAPPFAKKRNAVRGHRYPCRPRRVRSFECAGTAYERGGKRHWTARRTEGRATRVDVLSGNGERARSLSRLAADCGEPAQAAGPVDRNREASRRRRGACLYAQVVPQGAGGNRGRL